MYVPKSKIGKIVLTSLYAAFIACIHMWFMWIAIILIFGWFVDLAKFGIVNLLIVSYAISYLIGFGGIYLFEMVEKDKTVNYCPICGEKLEK